MTARIIVFGATGFTGQLTVDALVKRGARPVLAARNPDKLKALTARLGVELEAHQATADDAASVRALLQPGDVLLSTVGPFTLHGRPALDAAIAARAHYLDSTGEPNFIRQVFAEHERAQQAGSLLLTAFGYDYVPGHAAGGLALQRAGAAATRVDVGYFWKGAGSGASEGTLASTRVTAMYPGLEFRGGRLVERFGGVEVRDFELNGVRPGISVGGSEHYALPRSYPALRDVGVYMGWFGKRAYAISRGARVLAAVSKLPVLGRLPAALARRGAESSGRGPDAGARARSRSEIVAIASAADGRELARVLLTGQDGYGFTADILAWGAQQLAATAPSVSGARGPIEVFGLDRLLEGCREADLTPG